MCVFVCVCVSVCVCALCTLSCRASVVGRELILYTECHLSGVCPAIGSSFTLTHIRILSFCASVVIALVSYAQYV